MFVEESGGEADFLFFLRSLRHACYPQHQVGGTCFSLAHRCTLTETALFSPGPWRSWAGRRPSPPRTPSASGWESRPSSLVEEGRGKSIQKDVLGHCGGKLYHTHYISNWCITQSKTRKKYINGERASSWNIEVEPLIYLKQHFSFSLFIKRPPLALTI